MWLEEEGERAFISAGERTLWRTVDGGIDPPSARLGVRRMEARVYLQLQLDLDKLPSNAHHLIHPASPKSSCQKSASSQEHHQVSRAVTKRPTHERPVRAHLLAAPPLFSAPSLAVRSIPPVDIDRHALIWTACLPCFLVSVFRDRPGFVCGPVPSWPPGRALWPSAERAHRDPGALHGRQDQDHTRRGDVCRSR